MSSSSSSSPRYHLFINFRGEDTRRNFVCHLYAALYKKGIDTFLDDKKLEKGAKLKPDIGEAIKGSHISIVVFSKNYTKSSWCLDELVQIMECQRTYGQVVIPLFYNVEPTVVRNQKGAFGEGLEDTAREKYSERGMRKEDLLSKWKSALTEAANIKGWVAAADREFRDDVQLVEQIVEDVLEKLDMNSLPRIPTTRGISRLQLSVDNNNMGLGYLLTDLISKLTIVQVKFHSEVQLTRELRRFLFDPYNGNFTKLETLHTSQISDLSLKKPLIGMGSSYHMVIDTLKRSISQGLAGNGSSDSFLPGDNYPSWIAYKGEGPSVLFKVPEDSDCRMKGIILCVVCSSTPENMAAECLTGVLIINYTKCTVQLYKRDTVMSFNDEDWQRVISNLGAGDNVGIFVAFRHAVTVKETAVYLIYDQSMPMVIEPSPKPSPNLKIEPSPKPYEIFARLVRRVAECLCLN